MHPPAPAAPGLDVLDLPGREERLGDVDHAAVLRDLRPLRDARLSLVSLVGSRGYGLHTPASDYDYRGVYLAPTETLLGIGRPAEQLEAKEPDACIYELDKFVRLAINANPNILEILYADALVIDPVGRRLVENRHLFLSQRARQSYGGYVVQQLRRATQGRGDALYVRRREKAIRHLFRLFEQGIELLETGQLRVRVSDPEAIRAKSALTDAELETEMARLDERLQKLVSPLPDRPDHDAIDELVRSIRLETLRTG